MDPQSFREQTATTLVSHTTNGTEWRPGIIESKGIRTMHIEKHTNPYAFLKRIATEFGLELRFRVETNGNQITGRYVDLLERIGVWRGREVEFGKDL
ncbi:phage tail spike protein, partial [Micrococcus sp. SIMBA_144]